MPLTDTAVLRETCDAEGDTLFELSRLGRIVLVTHDRRAISELEALLGNRVRWVAEDAT